MSKLRVIPVTLAEANEFVSNFHRHADPVTGARFAIGGSDGSRMFGVAIVGRPVARMLQDGVTAEVNRCCVIDDAPKGACSFLYSRSWRAWQAMGGERLITYTLASESGASLRGAGWRCIGQTRPRAETEHAWGSAGRERDWRPIYGQLKLRWEAA